MRHKDRLVLMAVTLSILLTGAQAAEEWHPVLVDGLGVTWLINRTAIQQIKDGTEVWIKKTFDPGTAKKLSERYKLRPSSYDMEHWLLRQDRRATMLEVVRYDAEGRTIETFDFRQRQGGPDTRNIPPGSSMESIWRLLFSEVPTEVGK